MDLWHYATTEIYQQLNKDLSHVALQVSSNGAKHNSPWPCLHLLLSLEPCHLGQIQTAERLRCSPAPAFQLAGRKEDANGYYSRYFGKRTR